MMTEFSEAASEGTKAQEVASPEQDIKTNPKLEKEIRDMLKEFEEIHIAPMPEPENRSIFETMIEELFPPETANENEGATLTEQGDSPQEAVEQNTTLPEQGEAQSLQSRLTEEEKMSLKEETGWSDKIIDAIRTPEEAQLYKDAGLVEAEINGKPALIQPKIDGNDYNAKNWPDWSNRDLAEEGYPPRDKDGNAYELHHIGQNPDSPLAELTYDQHHSDGNFKILHTFEESNIDRADFAKERKEYWEARYQSL